MSYKTTRVVIITLKLYIYLYMIYEVSLIKFFLADHTHTEVQSVHIKKLSC